VSTGSSFNVSELVLIILKFCLIVIVPCPCCMAMLFVECSFLCMLHDHAAYATCSYRVSLMHVYIACLCHMSLLHVFATCPCCIHIACPCYMSVLCVHAAIHATFSIIFMLRVHAHPCCLPVLNVYASCSYRISLLYFPAVFPCCMPMLILHVNGASHVHVTCPHCISLTW
jgi:hypothetical protein